MDCGPLLSDAQVVEQNQDARRRHSSRAGCQWHCAGVATPPDGGGCVPIPRGASALGRANIFGDPRNWENAMDPISKPQRYRLQQAGFSDVEIGELAGKGEASVVVGAYLGPDTPPVPDPARARAAYDKCRPRPSARLRDGYPDPAAGSGSAVADCYSDHRCTPAGVAETSAPDAVIR